MPPDAQPREPRGRPSGGRFASRPVPAAPLPPSHPAAPDDLPPGVAERHGGTTLASHPDEYTELAERCYAETGIVVERSTRDYMMFLGLRGGLDAFPGSEPIIHPTTGEEAGSWAFTGGTALVSAHRVGGRFSEDIDIVFIPGAEGATRSRIGKAHGWLRDAIIAGITGDGVHAVASRGGVETSASSMLPWAVPRGS